MEQYVIKGGNPLNGEVEIGGAKNAAQHLKKSINYLCNSTNHIPLIYHFYCLFVI